MSIELFVTGLVLVAASETPSFDTFLHLWDHDLARAWEQEAQVQQWAFQQHGWGGPNRDIDEQP